MHGQHNRLDGPGGRLSRRFRLRLINLHIGADEGLRQGHREFSLAQRHWHVGAGEQRLFFRRHVLRLDLVRHRHGQQPRRLRGDARPGIVAEQSKRGGIGRTEAIEYRANLIAHVGVGDWRGAGTNRVDLVERPTQAGQLSRWNGVILLQNDVARVVVGFLLSFLRSDIADEGRRAWRLDRAISDLARFEVERVRLPGEIEDQTKHAENAQPKQDEA